MADLRSPEGEVFSSREGGCHQSEHDPTTSIYVGLLGTERRSCLRLRSAAGGDPSAGCTPGGSPPRRWGTSMKLRLQTSIAVLLVGLIVPTIAALGASSYYLNRDSANQLRGRILGDTARDVYGEIG